MDEHLYTFNQRIQRAPCVFRSRGGVEGVIDTDIPLELIERKADIPGLDLQQGEDMEGEDMEVDHEDFLDDSKSAVKGNCT